MGVFKNLAGIFLGICTSEKKIWIKDVAVNVRTSKDDNGYFSLTDMAKWKNSDQPDQVVANWMRTNCSIQFLGLWEISYNKNFNPVEFEGFRNQSNA